MDSLVARIYNAIRMFLSPPCCAACKKTLEYRTIFCSTCTRLLVPVAPLPLQITASKTIMVHAACLYQEPVRRLVLQKRSGCITGSYILADLIWQKTIFKDISCDVIVPVPLHWTRFLSRGFNQAREMGDMLARKKGCVCVDLVKRVKRTAYQSDLLVAHRADNVKDAFVLYTSAQTYTGKHLVLLDDLFTTGNTVRAIAKVLLTLKPASLSVLVACRALSVHGRG